MEADIASGRSLPLGLGAVQARIDAARREYDLTKGGLDDLQAAIDAATPGPARDALRRRREGAVVERARLLGRHRKATDAQWGWKAWATPDVMNGVEEIRAMQAHSLEARLCAEAVTGVARPEFPGVNFVVKVQLDDGSFAYHKPFSGLNGNVADDFDQDEALQPVHEAAAWQLAKRLGRTWRKIVCPCVLREVGGELGSLSVKASGMGHCDFRSAQNWEDAAFFDSLIGQQDRHSGNYAVDWREIQIYDHGFAFARPGDFTGNAYLVDERRRTSPRLTGKEKEALRRLLASTDLMGMRRALTPDRADALEDRARRMLAGGEILGADDY